MRSRKADTDYRRADRQRAVLAALARQVSLADALSGYSTVTSALGDRLRTSLTTDEFTNLLGLLGGETAIVESVGLVPPLVESEPARLRRDGEDRRARADWHSSPGSRRGTDAPVARHRPTVELCAPMSNQTDVPALDRLRRVRASATTRVAAKSARWFAGSCRWRRRSCCPGSRRSGVCRCSVCCCSRSGWRCRSCSRHGCSPTATTSSALALEPRFLTTVTAVGCAIVLTRLLAVAEVAHAFRRTRGIAGRTVVATLVVLALAVPVLLLSLRANQARTMVASVFGGGGPALYVPQQQRSTRRRSPTSCCSVATPARVGGVCAPTR